MTWILGAEDESVKENAKVEGDAYRGMRERNKKMGRAEKGWQAKYSLQIQCVWYFATI